MKHIFLIFLLINLWLPVWAQWDFPPSVELATQLTGNGERKISDVLVDKSGNIYVTGEFKRLLCYGDSCRQSASPDSSDIFVCKLDSSLNLQWLKRLGGSGIDTGLDLAFGSSAEVLLAVRFSGRLALADTLIVANFPGIGFYSPTDFALLRILEGGDIHLAYHPGGNSFNILEHMESQEGTTVLSGRFSSGRIEYSASASQNDFGGAPERFVLVLDSIHNFKHQIELTEQDRNPFSISSIELIDSGMYWLGSFRDTLTIDGQYYTRGEGKKDFLLYMSFGGTVHWVKLLPPTTFFSNSIGSDIKGNLLYFANVIAPSMWDSNPIDRGGTLFKVLKDGTEISSVVKFDSPPGPLPFFIHSILRNENGIYMAGFLNSSLTIRDSTFSASGNNGYALIIHVAPQDGEIAWVKQLGIGAEQIELIQPLPSGALVVTGSFWNNVISIDSFLIFNSTPNLNANFIAKFATEDFFSGRNGSNTRLILVYPNPTKEILCIQGQWENDPVLLSIFDLNGRKVQEEISLPRNENQVIQLTLSKDLSAGMYHLMVNQSEMRYAQKFVIE